MPELPEVETVKNTLKQLVVGKTISDVSVRWPKMVKHPADVQAFQTLLTGQTIHDINRRGKFLRFDLDDVALVSHLRMEGKYSLTDTPVPTDQHTHVIFKFTDGTALQYNDVRKFGTMHLYDKGKELQFPPLADLGPEPLEDDFTANHLDDVFRRTTRLIKPVLLDQKAVVGLGNIYVDEALFRAGIHPGSEAKAIPFAQMNDLVLAIRSTLGEAIAAGGSSIRSYLNGHGEMGMFQQRLYVYAREDQPCKQCGTPIEKIKLGGRGTHFCPNCQKEWHI
ncbi:DNA-formamidopyrimidine glycosylase [Tuberibacillus sp. Marseille-P3662]|uniref:DNA-formamidopyrimidine glycosylase n=1 Tax=Tuberibacillus sp. Marseille-P3662 TaxID=1965358 RepID=UPI000A1CA589|nr:DNA-formamidopyrimidine glycosylase [Tuberibacillus sp. Marseille-P3662]